MLYNTILQLIKKDLPDAVIELNDYKHDGLHIVLTVKSKEFKDLSLVQQHRLVYKAVGDFIKTGEVHAFKIKTITIN